MEDIRKKIVFAMACLVLLFAGASAALPPPSIEQTIEILMNRPVNVMDFATSIDGARFSLGKKDSKTVTLEGSTLAPVKPGKATLTVITKATSAMAEQKLNASVRVYSEKEAAKEILGLVNAARKKAGLKKLSLSENLNKAAKVRAAELKDAFSHNRPDGRTYDTAFDEAKAKYLYKGENIAAGQGGPAHVMRDWINSPAHLATILYPNFTHMGASYVIMENGTVCWAQEFGGK